MKTGWKKLGVVGVDSGTLMITDPCYITDDRWTGKDYDKELLDEGWKFFKQVKNSHGVKTSVIFSSGFGDGSYKVWGYFENYPQDVNGKKHNDFRIKEVKIVLIEEEN